MEHAEKQQVAEELVHLGWGLIELSGVRVEIMLSWIDRTTGFFSAWWLCQRKEGRTTPAHQYKTFNSNNTVCFHTQTMPGQSHGA